MLGLSEMRGPAPVAQALYREMEASRELRLKLAAERKTAPHFENLVDAVAGEPAAGERASLGPMALLSTYADHRVIEVGSHRPAQRTH